MIYTSDMKATLTAQPVRKTNGRVSSGRATIGEIAKICGLSKSTVSRVLNEQLDVFKISASTAEQIRKTAAELGYRQNRLARAMASGRTHLIGLSLPFVPHHTDPHDYFVSPIILDQLAGIFSDPRFESYDLVIHKRVAGKPFDAKGDLLDGMLFVDPEGECDSRLREWSGQLPIVVLGSACQGSKMTFVDVDNAGLIAAAIDAATARGRRIVGYLEPRLLESFRCMEIRRNAFLKKMPGGRVISLDLDPAEIRHTLAALPLKPGRDAMVVAEEMTGCLASQCLRDLGFRVPEDILLVTVGGEQPAVAANAGLEVIAIPFERIAKTAIGMLLEHLEHGRPLKGELVKVSFSPEV